MANDVRRKYIGSRLELCTIMNAKSGDCLEDCRFCSQSTHYKTSSPIYSLKNQDEIIAHAERAKSIGAIRFSLVTSGYALEQKDLDKIASAIYSIKQRVDIKICASIGCITGENLLQLKSAGLDRYHHNIETSEEYFKHITTTHRFKDRVDTIERAKNAGIEVCSGGIIGMGETMEDRINMLLYLCKLDVDAIPLNILIPIPGTPFENIRPISVVDIIKTIALFRLALGGKTINIAAGRLNYIKDFQGLLFLAGANGLMIGNYLTTAGRSIIDDKKLIDEIKLLWNG